MQNSVATFFQLKIKRKQRYQVRQQFQHFESDMNRTFRKVTKIQSLITFLPSLQKGQRTIYKHVHCITELITNYKNGPNYAMNFSNLYCKAVEVLYCLFDFVHLIFAIEVKTHTKKSFIRRQIFRNIIF